MPNSYNNNNKNNIPTSIIMRLLRPQTPLRASPVPWTNMVHPLMWIATAAAVQPALALLSYSTSSSSGRTTTSRLATSLYAPHYTPSFTGVRSPLSSTHSMPTQNSFAPTPAARPYSTSTPLHMSYNNNDNDKSLWSSIKNVAKSTAKAVVPKALLPNKWFRTPEQERAAIERQRVQDEIRGGLSDILKDAPLPIRMMGRMVGPLVSSAMSAAAEQMAEQQATMQETLTQAQRYIANDVAVQAAFGTTVQVGSSPFSQSSSTTNINGQVRQQVQLAVQVSGSNGAVGIAQIRATESGIQSIQVVDQSTGRSINVSLTESSSSSFFKKSNGDDDTIIEAEIIEKDYDKRS